MVTKGIPYSEAYWNVICCILLRFGQYMEGSTLLKDSLKDITCIKFMECVGWIYLIISHVLYQYDVINESMFIWSLFGLSVLIMFVHSGRNQSLIWLLLPILLPCFIIYVCFVCLSDKRGKERLSNEIRQLYVYMFVRTESWLTEYTTDMIEDDWPSMLSSDL
tara:strand:- start:75 stop:563 length:489 start_codon:yes stop_codon:yes gene_type:complete